MYIDILRHQKGAAFPFATIVSMLKNGMAGATKRTIFMSLITH